MISRNGSQRGAPNRRFSTNNPFRKSVDAGAISPVAYGAYSSGGDPLDDFVRSGSPTVSEETDMQYGNGSYSSAGSSRVHSPIDGSFRYV